MRHNNGGRISRAVERSNEVHEHGFYEIGEVQDFVDRNEPIFCSLIDAVAAQRLDPEEAKDVIREVFADANKELDEYRVARGDLAKKYDYPYLHGSLKIARVLAPLPDVIA